MRPFIFICFGSLFFFSCQKKDTPDPRTNLLGNWEVQSATLDCFEAKEPTGEDELKETFSRSADSSYIEFRNDYTYLSTDFEAIQPFSVLGNPYFSQFFTEGGMWEQVYDFRAIYLDKGVNELNSDPYVILDINQLTSAVLNFTWRINQSQYPNDSTAYRFAYLVGLDDGINIFSRFDTTSNGAFDLGFLCGKAHGFYFSDPTDVSANYGYWRGLILGYINFNINKSDTFRDYFISGYQAGVPVGEENGQNLGVPHPIKRKYELHYQMKKAQ